jgi:hypothetical protein
LTLSTIAAIVNKPIKENDMNKQLTATYNEVCSAIHSLSSRHPMETVNSYMRASIESAFMSSKTKKEFISTLKKETGMTSVGISKCKACQYMVGKL